MAAYKGLSRRYKDALKSYLATIQLDGGSGPENAFYAVLDTPKGQFDGYPTLMVMPGSLDDEKASVRQTTRTLNLILRTYVLLEADKPQANAYDQLYDLTDLLLDTLDQGDINDSLKTYDATLTNWMLNASRGEWAAEQTPAGVVITADVNVEIRYTKSY